MLFAGGGGGRLVSGKLSEACLLGQLKKNSGAPCVVEGAVAGAVGAWNTTGGYKLAWARAKFPRRVCFVYLGNSRQILEACRYASEGTM